MRITHPPTYDDKSDLLAEKFINAISPKKDFSREEKYQEIKKNNFYWTFLGNK
jgi:hypothetical protein